MGLLKGSFFLLILLRLRIDACNNDVGAVANVLITGNRPVVLERQGRRQRQDQLKTFIRSTLDALHGYDPGFDVSDGVGGLDIEPERRAQQGIKLEVHSELRRESELRVPELLEP